MKRVLLKSGTFVRTARRLAKKNPPMVDSILEVLNSLESDAFDAPLKTHKLKGELAGSWACSAGYDLRIVFEFVEHEGAEAILLQSIGTHDEVY